MKKLIVICVLSVLVLALFKAPVVSFLVPVAVLGVVWHRSRKDPLPKGYGLLTSKKRPKLSKAEAGAYASDLVVSIQSRNVNGRDDPREFILQEILRLSKEWQSSRDGDLLSADEYRSINLLKTYASHWNKPMDHLLEDVAEEHKALFHDLRARVTAWHRDKDDARSDHKAWLEHVGNPDASHLLANGWVAFLESLPQADPVLYHQIVTEFHEDGDRMDEKFWILSQPECDIGTVAAFLRGYLNTEYFGQDYPKYAEHVRSVIELYNQGYYKHHGYGFDMVDVACEGDAALEKGLREIERCLPDNKMPRPMNLPDHKITPPDDRSNAYRSPYDFWDDAGLHLSYPGRNWRDAA